MTIFEMYSSRMQSTRDLLISSSFARGPEQVAASACISTRKGHQDEIFASLATSVEKHSVGMGFEVQFVDSGDPPRLR